MKTTIPKRLFRELSKLAEDAPDKLVSLGNDLTQVAPQLYPFDSLSATVRRSIGVFKPDLADPSRSDDRQREFSGELAQSISSLLYTAGASHLPMTEVLAAAIQTIEENFQDSAESLEAFVRTILGCSDLVLSFKSTALREDNENIVVDSKIIVDIRPVFDTEQSDAIRAHALLYRLKITHRTSSDVDAKIYTLSQEALDELSQAVTRAKLKIEHLKSMPLSQTLGMLLEENK
jgi:hypothetical protein